MNTFRSKLQSIIKRHDDVRNILNNSDNFDPKEFAKLSKEFSDLSDISKEIKKLFSKEKELDDAKELAYSEQDSDLKNMDEIEFLNLKK